MTVKRVFELDELVFNSQENTPAHLLHRIQPRKSENFENMLKSREAAWRLV